MAPPKEAFQIHGGCNCQAVRYTVHVPVWDRRAAVPYHSPGVTLPGDPRLPFAAIDHCNDCRSATGALLGFVLITETAWVQTVCRTRSSGSLALPAGELFDFTTIADKDVYLTCYKSSPQRSRWFCAQCGTALAYSVDPGALPPEWGWPTMLDFWMGSIDRVDLEKDWMAPSGQLWCEKGIPWIRELARHGSRTPEHPTFKMDEVEDTSRSIDDIVVKARSHLERLTPQQAWKELKAQTSEKPVVLVDIRPIAQRKAEGFIDSALVIERNVLEWRLDPRSDAKIPQADKDLRVIVHCQEGYTTPLAANSLRDLGLLNATDMIGGFAAWKDAGLPTRSL